MFDPKFTFLKRNTRDDKTRIFKLYFVHWLQTSKTWPEYRIFFFFKWNLKFTACEMLSRWAEQFTYCVWNHHAYVCICLIGWRPFWKRNVLKRFWVQVDEMHTKKKHDSILRFVSYNSQVLNIWVFFNPGSIFTSFTHDFGLLLLRVDCLLTGIYNSMTSHKLFSKVRMLGLGSVQSMSNI